jgi:hypothetical protein
MLNAGLSCIVKRAASVRRFILTDHEGRADCPPIRPAKQLRILPTFAYKKGVQILFLYVTVVKCRKTARTIENIDCIRVFAG